MAGFNVMDMLNKTSKEGIEEKPKARFRTKDIDIYNIYANEDNISDQIGIDEKAAEIKLLGLLQPLEVMYEPNQSGEEYKLIGGERRWRALKKLVEEEDLQEFREATCQIRKPRSKNEEIIELCISNSYRKATPEKELERIKLLTDALKDAKAAGEKIMGYDLESGRLRDIAAKILGKKPTQIADAISGLIKFDTEEQKTEHVEIPQTNKVEVPGNETDERRHRLKLAKMFFDAVDTGKKSFELRKNDRNYQIGDVLELHEMSDGEETGRVTEKQVIYILEGFKGLEEGYCILGLSEVEDI